MRFALPRFWDGLLARVSPVIGIVIVKEELESKSFRLLRQCNGVWEAVGKSGGCVKQAKANPIVAVVSQDLQARLRLSFILEDNSLLLGLREERNIRSHGIVLTNRS